MLSARCITLPMVTTEMSYFFLSKLITQNYSQQLNKFNRSSSFFFSFLGKNNTEGETSVLWIFHLQQFNHNYEYSQMNWYATTVPVYYMMTILYQALPVYQLQILCS